MSDEKMNIFVKIKNQEDVEKITRSLSTQKYQISAKLPTSSEHIVFLEAQSLIRNELGCKIKFIPPGLNLPEIGSLVIQAQMGEDIILAQPQYSIRGESIFLRVDCDFFQLQRREDFRLRIPTSFHSQMRITSKNGNPLNYSGSVVDISSGGCRIESHRRNFPVIMNDKISGEISFSNRPNLEVSGVVRHIAPLPDNLETDLVGIQFQDLSAQSKNRIFALMMDIHRELFSKLR